MTTWVYLEDIQTWAKLYGWPTNDPRWFAVSWKGGLRTRKVPVYLWDSIEKCSVYNDIMKSGGSSG
jgi:hypothetical protein